MIITFLVLLLHSMYFMHRIAGPLYRFTALFRSIGTGQLHQRVHLRKHDYLHREAQAFNSMLDHFENKIQAINLQSALVIQAYEAVVRGIQEQASDQIAPALQMLDEEMRRFKTCLEEYELQTQPQHNQRRFECTESSDSKSLSTGEAA
ncbi:MAG: methyl-accepting chemotaxis protein [Nitrospirae bacterium]|nr:methyl-accepting chemotaxis protein [Nitrospirota bacterium]